jgi:hypothetical protein
MSEVGREYWEMCYWAAGMLVYVFLLYIQFTTAQCILYQFMSCIHHDRLAMIATTAFYTHVCTSSASVMVKG